MKTILKLSLLSLLLIIIGDNANAQSVTKEEVLEYSKQLKERVEKIYKVLPKGNDDRSVSLTPYPDTIITESSGIVEEIIAFEYGIVNGEKLIISLSLTDVESGETGILNLEYNTQNRVSLITGNIFEEGIEVPIKITIEYDNFGITTKMVTSVSFLGFPIDQIFETVIVRDENDRVIDITNYDGISSIIFGEEIYKTERIAQITYDNNIPVSYFYYTYFFDDFEELDSTILRYSNLLWHQYDGQILRQMTDGSFELELNSESFLDSPSREHLDRLISATIEEYIDGEWVLLEEITLNEISATSYDISINGFINTREVITMDVNKFLLQKDIYYDFHGGEVSEREVYTYTDFQLEESYRRYFRTNDELTLDQSGELEYTFDANDRIIQVNEMSDNFEDYTTRFIYSGTTSAPGKKIINTNVEVFPNPVQSILHLNSQEFNMTNAEYLIYDLNGRVIMSSQNRANDNTQINVSTLGSGMYILQLRNANQIATVKFSKI